MGPLEQLAYVEGRAGLGMAAGILAAPPAGLCSVCVTLGRFPPPSRPEWGRAVTGASAFISDLWHFPTWTDSRSSLVPRLKSSLFRQRSVGEFEPAFAFRKLEGRER